MVPTRIMVLDTETCSLDGGVYDVGYTISNKRGDILHKRNHLVREVFTNAPRMMGALFAGKHFTYYADALQRGLITLLPWTSIIELMRADAMAYNVNVLAAYNLKFDRKVMRANQREFSDGTNALYPMRQLCIWQFAKQVKAKTRLYKRWCREHGYLTKTGMPKTTAEIIYRYITADWNFSESHTALDDALIETEILSRLFAAKKRIPFEPRLTRLSEIRLIGE